MAYVDSSVGSPKLAALAGATTAGVPPDAPEFPQPQDEPAEEDAYQKPRPGSAQKGTRKALLEDFADDVNIARRLTEERLRGIGMMVVDEFRIDDNSRADWVDGAQKALRMASQRTDEKTSPWPNCSNVVFPMISQAAYEFGARAYPALIPGRKVVKGVVWGDDKGTPTLDESGQPKMAPPGPDGQPQPVWMIAPGEKRQRADRISEHMSYQLLKEIPEWEGQTDRLLHQIPVIGGAARKTFRDHAAGRQASLYVELANLVWNYGAPSFEAAQRHTEKLLIYPNEISDYERTELDDNDEGMWLALDYSPGDGIGANGTTFGFRRDERTGDGAQDLDAPHLFLEQHRWLDLDEDGYPEPYAVTVHARSSKVVRIVARFEADDILTEDDDEDAILKVEAFQHYTLIPFLPSLDGGSYPMGFGHLLLELNDQINTTLNQMFDAGTLQNAGGGFMSNSLNAPSGQVLFSVGKFHRVDTRGQSIRDAVFPIPWQGPSSVLFQVLGLLIESGKGIASLQNVLSGDASIANASPTTVLALMEQGMSLYTAIYKRIYRALTQEFEKLYRLNRRYLREKTVFPYGEEEREVLPSDYKTGGGVLPEADPKMVTDMQKMARGQLLMSFKDDPLINQQEIRRRMLDDAGIERVEDVLAPPNPMAQMAQQLEMAMKQAELGRVRAAEQKDQTQALLNLALVRKNASAPEEAWLEGQMEFLRYHIEALNTEVKAQVALTHARGEAHDQHAGHMQDVRERAAILAETHPSTAHAMLAGGLQPAPAGPMPVPPTAPVGPDVTSAAGPGTGTPAVPGPGEPTGA